MPHVIDLRRLNSHLRYISLLSFPVLTHRTPKIGQDFTGIFLHFSFFLSEQKNDTNQTPFRKFPASSSLSFYTHSGRALGTVMAESRHKNETIPREVTQPSGNGGYRALRFPGVPISRTGRGDAWRTARATAAMFVSFAGEAWRASAPFTLNVSKTAMASALS